MHWSIPIVALLPSLMVFGLALIAS